MGRADVERALRAMDDDEIRERLSQGHFEAVSRLDLTDDERTLVRDAAGDYPDEAAFSFDTFAKSSTRKHITKAQIMVAVTESGEALKGQLAAK